MRIFLILAIAAIAGFAASSIPARGRHVLSCSTTEGTVNTYYPGLTTRTCHTPMGSMPPLFATETLTSNVGGSFDFGTHHLNECKQVPTTTPSVDQIRPDSTTAIRHFGGLTWCKHKATDKQGYLRISRNKRVTIQPRGTILGLDTAEHGTTLKVADGSAIVSQPGSHPIVVPQRFELLIANSGQLGKPSKLQLTPTDATAVTELELGVEEGGAKQFSEYLRVRKQTAAVVIATDTPTAQQQAALLPNVKVTSLLAPELLASPQSAVAELKQIAASGVKTFITIGTVDQMTPVWTLIHGAGLPTTEVILFAATG
jgi:hypothetical protein